MIGGSDSGRGHTRNGTGGTTLSLSQQQQVSVPAIEAGVSGFHCFISYRRTGVATARNVKQSMEKVGYSCFMDFEDLNVGDFQAQLEKNLAGTPVVIVILTPGSLTTDARWDGGGRPGETDWLQREVQLALQMKKLVVPVRSMDFVIEKEFASVPTGAGAPLLLFVHAMLFSLGTE